MKKRIFIANDASFLTSGYGVYGKELLTRLHNSGKYEVAELGCYSDITNSNIKNIPWKYYPNAVTVDDARYKTYKESTLNQFGAWRFNRVILDFKPHIVFDIRDYWMYSYQEMSPFRKYFHWILMPTVDSAPQKAEWYYTFANADVVIPYTEWAKQVLLDSHAKINLFPNIANAGINPNEFYPIENKSAHKIKYLGSDMNVIGLVMRNQKRKLIPDILMAFSNYLTHLKNTNQDEQYNKTCLYMHTSYPEENGWDLPGLLLEYGLLDKVYFSYICKNCNSYFASKFQNSVCQCRVCNQAAATFANLSNSASTQQLNEIYNLFDLFVQYAICEGFGMPQIEAASCGIPVASVDYSAMSEIVRNLNGFPIKVERLFRELETLADRAYPSIDDTVSIFKNFFELDSSLRIALGRTARKKCLETYTWDHVYKTWDSCFDSIDISQKPDWNNAPVSKTNHESLNVPRGLNPKEFVQYICFNILNEPYIFMTAPIQQLVKELTSKLVCKGGVIKTVGFKEATDILESHLNNKILCEKLRTQPELLKPEDYLNVNH